MNRLDPIAAAVIDLKRILTGKIEPPDAKALVAMARDTHRQLKEQTELGVDVSDVEAFLRETGQQYAQMSAAELTGESKPTDELRAKVQAAVEAARILGADVNSIEAPLSAA